MATQQVNAHGVAQPTAGPNTELVARQLSQSQSESMHRSCESCIKAQAKHSWVLYADITCCVLRSWVCDFEKCEKGWY